MNVSITEIFSTQGYWLVMNNVDTLILDNAFPTVFENNNIQYELHLGNNLISYPFNSNQN